MKSTMNLFNIYFFNVLMLCVFGVGFNTFFLLIISLIRMIFFLLSDGSPLIKLVKLAVIIWMIWRMRNYARFQDKIEVSSAILVIKDLICLVGNSSKASMKNDMFDFNVLKFFGINTRTGKVLHPLLVRWEFPSPAMLKLTLMGLLRVIQVLPLV